MKENKISKYQFYSFFIILYLVIYVTNNHFTFQESLIFGGADGLSYYNISKDAPLITEQKITPIHSERFIFPYLIGLLSKILNIEIFIMYKFFVMVVLLLININLFNIFKILKLEKDSIFIFLILVNFNPYISRYYIAIPTIINDLILILGFTIIIKNLISIKKNHFSTFRGFFLSFASRQTSIALVLSYLITFFLTKNRIFNKKLEIIILASFVIILILSFYYSSHTFDQVSERAKLYSLNTRLFGLFLQNLPFVEKIIFLILPFLSFGPILIYIFLNRKIKINFKDVINSSAFIFLGLLILIVILQPILSGPDITGRNIIRLTTLSYIPLLVLLILVSNQRNTNFKFLFCFFGTILAFLHSLHPTFSRFSYFDFLRF